MDNHGDISCLIKLKVYISGCARSITRIMIVYAFTQAEMKMGLKL